MKKNTEFMPNTTSSRIIENGVTKISILDSRLSLLPDLYLDAISLSFGLGEYDAISDKEIAEIFSEEYRVQMTEDLVSGIIKDALLMLRFLPEYHPVINLSEELPGGIPNDIHGAELTWNEIKRLLYSCMREDDIDEYLAKKFGDADYVIIPRIDSVYTTWSPTWSDPDGFDTVLTNADVQDYRGMAEFIINKLDKMGLCIVRSILAVKQISPEDIYLYAYLDNDLARKIIYDNTIELIKKIRQLQGLSEKGEKE